MARPFPQAIFVRSPRMKGLSHVKDCRQRHCGMEYVRVVRRSASQVPNSPVSELPATPQADRSALEPAEAWPAKLSACCDRKWREWNIHHFCHARNATTYSPWLARNRIGRTCWTGSPTLFAIGFFRLGGCKRARTRHPPRVGVLLTLLSPKHSPVLLPAKWGDSYLSSSFNRFANRTPASAIRFRASVLALAS
jgi:hypothetical protein